MWYYFIHVYFMSLQYLIQVMKYAEPCSQMTIT